MFNPMMNAMGAGKMASSPQTAIGMFNPAGRPMPQQAMQNAQGQPFQPGGKFNPVTTMPINPIQQVMSQQTIPQDQSINQYISNRLQNFRDNRTNSMQRLGDQRNATQNFIQRLAELNPQQRLAFIQRYSSGR